MSDYENVCEQEARFRIENNYPELPPNKKERAIKKMKKRLANMYDDIFEANHMNTIAQDCVGEEI